MDGSEEALPSKNLFRHYSLQKDAADIKLSEIERERKYQEDWKILGRKAKILWQLENLQNYKDLYGKPLERDWRATRFFPYKSF